MFSLKAGVPLFNATELYTIGEGIINRPAEFEDIDYYIEKVPELLKIVGAVQEDVISSGIYFEGSERAISRAESFWEENFVKEELKKSIFDWLLYGDGYLWKGQFDSEERQQLQAKALSMLPPHARGFEFKADEDEVNFVRHVPSSTMNIDLNKERTAIAKFRQVINGIDVRSWVPDEVVHAKFYTVKGSVYGFSPARALLQEVQTIGYIKDYASTWFRDGGTPDWLFSFVNEPPSSQRVKELEMRLKKYKSPLEKHGNLVSTGELKPFELNKFTKDMEYRQLLIQYAGICAFAYGLPAGRLSSIIGAEVKVSTGSDDLANEAYWNQNRNYQDYWETLLNTQLFSKFGKVKLKFHDTHKIDQVREAQAKMQTVDYLTKLREFGVEPKMSMVQDLLGIKNDYLKSKTLGPMASTMKMQGFQSNEKLNKDTAGQGLSRDKKKQQNTDNSDKQNLGV